MRLALIPLVLASLAACTQTVAGTAPPVAAAPATDGYDLAAQRAKLAVIEMNPDTSYLTAEERQVVNLLIDASGYMDEIYKHQRLPNYEQVRQAIERNRRADRDLLLEMFDRYYGPWDELAELHPFWGTDPMPEGALRQRGEPGIELGSSECQLVAQQVDHVRVVRGSRVLALRRDRLVVGLGHRRSARSNRERDRNGPSTARRAAAGST